VDYGAFQRQAEHGQLPPVVLIHGADAQVLDDALALVGRRLFPEPAHALLDREVLDGREVEPEAIVSAASTLPVQAATRLVAVRHAEGIPTRGAEVLGRYVRDPNPAALLLLLAAEPLGAGRERRSPHWLLGVVPPAAVVEPVPRRGRALEEWLRQRAAADGLAVSEEAARLLVQWVGEDGAALLGEARKAALAGGPDNRTVGVNEVTAVVGEHRLSGVFDLTRAIERREVGLALRTLDRLLATEDPLPILAALARDLRTAWTVREWRAGGRSVDQIARALRRPPAVVEALAAAAGAQPVPALAARLRRCWEVERRIKSGGEPRAEMTALVAELCGRTPGPAGA
jgi:DNA polymerase III delta subunit